MLVLVVLVLIVLVLVVLVLAVLGQHHYHNAPRRRRWGAGWNRRQIGDVGVRRVHQYLSHSATTNALASELRRTLHTHTQ